MYIYICLLYVIPSLIGFYHGDGILALEILSLDGDSQFDELLRYSSIRKARGDLGSGS